MSIERKNTKSSVALLCWQRLLEGYSRSFCDYYYWLFSPWIKCPRDFNSNFHFVHLKNCCKKQWDAVLWICNNNYFVLYFDRLLWLHFFYISMTSFWVWRKFDWCCFQISPNNSTTIRYSKKLDIRQINLSHRENPGRFSHVQICKLPSLHHIVFVPMKY